jgi:hypothetical protein
MIEVNIKLLKIEHQRCEKLPGDFQDILTKKGNSRGFPGLKKSSRRFPGFPGSLATL